MDTPQRLSNLKKIPYKSSSFLLISKALAEELRETWMFFSVEVSIMQHKHYLSVVICKLF